MNDAQRDAIRKQLDKRTKDATKTEQSARKFLIDGGFYTPEGKLTPAYGGKKKSA